MSNRTEAQIAAIQSTIDQFQKDRATAMKMGAMLDAYTEGEDIGSGKFKCWCVVTTNDLPIKYDRDFTNPRPTNILNVTRLSKDDAASLAAITFNGNNERGEFITIIELDRRQIEHFDSCIAQLSALLSK